MSLLLYDDVYIARVITGQYQGEDSAIRLNAFQKCLVLLLKAGMAACYCGIWVLCRIPLVSSLYETFARCYSRGGLGFFLRGAYYKNRLRRIGRNVFIDVGVTIWSPENVEIDDYSHIDTYVTILGGDRGHGGVQVGKYVHVASNCVLAGRGGLRLGDYSAVAAGCHVYSGSLYYEDPEDKSGKLLSVSAQAPLDMQYAIEKPVLIDEYAVVLLNSSILPGVTVGKAAVVGAHSLVNSDIPPFSIAVGTPARVVKKRREPGAARP